MSFRLYLLLYAVLWAPATAHAYVDPGTGMLLWQGLIAAVGAGLVFIRNPRHAIKRVIDRIFRR